MKKSILVFSLICQMLCADSVRLIDQAAVDQAQKTVAQELFLINRKRLIGGCLSGAVLAAAGYGCVRWWFSSVPVNRVESNQNTSKPNVVAPPKMSLWQHTKSWTGYIASGSVALFSHMLIGNAAAEVVGKSTNWFVHYFQAPDWRWMVHDRTRLYMLLGNLKYIAASLDPKSSLFDPLAHVTITLADYASVQTAQGHCPVSSFDELIHLRSLAQKTSDAQQAICQKQLVGVWNLVIEAVIATLGFVACRQHDAIDVSAFDQQQLDVMCNQIVQYTNSMSQQIPQLLAQTTAESSSGLLASVYGYCNYIAHACAVLEINAIIAGT